MSDIAERMKKLIENLKSIETFSPDDYPDAEFEVYAVMLSHDEIQLSISALQFADDMQTLADRDPRFNRITTGFECWINMYNPQQRTSWKQEFTGKDIPEAARAAVEQMEGK